MIAVGALIALLWAPADIELGATVEFVGSLIGILGVVFLISGIFYTKQRVIPTTTLTPNCHSTAVRAPAASLVAINL